MRASSLPVVRMRKWQVAVLAVVLFLVFLVVTLPAPLAYGFLKKKLAPDLPLQLGNVSGTVWSGRAMPAQIGGQRVDSLSWSIQPLALLIGRVQAQLEFRYGDSYGTAVVARGFTGKIYAKDIEARIDLKRMRLLSKLLPLGMEGALLLNMKTFSVDRRSIIEADGVLAWDGAIITVPARTEFGNLRVTLSTDSENVKAALADGGGPLQAEGLLNVTREGNYKFTGAFAARDPNQRMLVQGLQMLGRQGADGKVSIVNNGALSQLFGYFEKPETAAATK
jgi:general secretion pathway protein N